MAETEIPAPAAIGAAVSQIADGVTAATKASVTQTHNADDQSAGTVANSLNTSGVGLILSSRGTTDRVRETSFDGVPAQGITTGSAQFGVLSSSTIAAVITANAAPQAVTPASMAGIVVGQLVRVGNGRADQEDVKVTAVTATTFTAIFAVTHPANAPTQAFTYNIARDAGQGDNIALTGLSASMTYLYNQNSLLAELDRSAAGELDGATGRGTAVAAEYEFNGGGPPNAAGVENGFAFDRARSVQAKGRGTSTITTTVAGNTTVVFPSAAATNTITPGEAFILTGAGAGAETVYATAAWVPGSAAAVPIQAPVVNAGQNSAYWDSYNSIGPGLNGFSAIGVGIEEEALYDPVTGLFFIERAATQDNVPPQNVVMENAVLWNGTGMDRMKGANANPTSGVGVEVSAVGLAGLVSLTAVSAAGAGAALDGGVCHSNHTLQIVASAGTTAGAVKLEGSLDGTNWYQLIAPVNTTAAGVLVGNIGAFPARFVRANVSTAIVGGTVTVTVSSAG